MHDGADVRAVGRGHTNGVHQLLVAGIHRTAIKLRGYALPRDFAHIGKPAVVDRQVVLRPDGAADRMLGVTFHRSGKP